MYRYTECFTGGWVGYMGYDTVRYQYQNKLPFSNAPEDDRNLPDLCLGLYRDVVGAVQLLNPV